MKAVIIDDEKSVRETTRGLLSIYFPEIEILGEASGVKEGIELVKSAQPDLVFLDIEMGDGTGFDLLNHFPERQFAFIFITAHNDYAIKAFKFSAIDYVLKPVDPDDLKKAVNKAQKELNSGLSNQPIESYVANKQTEKNKKIVLSDADSMHLIDTSEIIYCEASDNYTNFYLTNDRKIIISSTLKEYDTLFSDLSFYRTHQSYLINFDHLDRFDKREGGIAIMKSAAQVPVSTRKKEGLIEVLKRL